jgi:4-hydroxybenzoyl-CoA thioesterase
MKPTLETLIQFGDCDEAGIVFYPRYFYWMDSAFQGLLRAHGWSQRKLRGTFGTMGTPLVKATANFLAPSTYEETLTVAAGIARWGNSSFEIGYKGSADGHPVFEGWETRVWMVPTGGRPKAGAIPDGFRKTLGEPTAKLAMPTD